MPDTARLNLADGTSLGYIIPTDCPLLRDDPNVFVNKAVSMKDMEAYSLRIRSKHVLMLFDSCFSGSLFSLVRAVPADITEKSARPVRQYITAGTAEETVPDRSMFKRSLLIGLEGDADLTRDGYITGTELGLYLSDKVVQSTRSAQHPQYGKIRPPELSRGDFIFHLASSGAVIEAPSKAKDQANLSIESNISGAKVFVHRFTLGDRIVNLVYDLLELLTIARYTKKKLPELNRANLLLKRLRLLLRLSSDLKAMSIKTYGLSTGIVQEVGNMLGGWIRQLKAP